jgi:hypothetical protein
MTGEYLMNSKAKFRLWIILTLLLSMFFSSVNQVQGQGSQPISANGHFWRAGTSEYYNVPWTLVFSPAGGDVYGSANWSETVTEDDGSVNSMDVNWDFVGTYAGGDGGVVAGTMSGTAKATGYPTFYFSGPWSGNLYASGIGEGVFDATVTAEGESASGQYKWQVNFSAEDFAAGLKSTITAEFIAATYGIPITNVAGGSGQKEWSEHELGLLNDLLKEIPKEFLANLSLQSIARADVYYEGSLPDPSTFGVYRPSSSSIVIFDHASSPYDFQDDPNGDKQFKATILHELVHALQYKKDEYSNFDNPYKSPLVQSYMDATTPLNAVDTGIWENGWTYFEDRGENGNWKKWNDENEKSPTNYGQSNPCEDMSESVMMYVYDPEKLKISSPLRYNFIRDQIFGGIEYENGVQK